MHTARCLVQGVDLWLNNPRRPLEASGTSGQKVCFNGGINFSVLDGWWCEGYQAGVNGWAIGEDLHTSNQELQDQLDSESLYRLLETEIIVPMYYDRDAEGFAPAMVATDEGFHSHQCRPGSIPPGCSRTILTKGLCPQPGIGVSRG
jgi:starch phosphorylase